MCGSFLHPLTCGFARGVAWQISAQVDTDENLKFKENETRKDYIPSMINTMFEKITGHSLVKALTRVKDLNIQEKKSTVEKKRTVRNNYRKFKETVENEWQSTSFVR